MARVEWRIALLAALLPASAARAEVPVFTLEIRDHLFYPSELVIPADTKVKLIVANLDPTPEEFESYELNREKVIMGGDEKGKRIFMEGDVKMAHHTEARQNELLRTTLSLLLTAPEGMDVSYTYGGEGDVDGTTCNIVNASFGGSIIKLYLSKASSLPVMVSYQGHDLPRMMVFKKAPEGADASNDVVMFDRKIVPPRAAEFNIRFSDFRGTNGVQLPYRWTTSVNGQTSEVFDITGYEINTANIAEKFQNQKVFVRTKGSN